MNKLPHQYQVNKLVEGLRRGDLKHAIDETFTIDQYQSKMGNDKDVMVLRFRVADKEPAIDLMEFIEKGYPFVLDADMSSGEERDGKYSVFVEIERTQAAPGQIKELVNGVSQLCDSFNWRFRFYKDTESYDLTEDELSARIPLTAEDYEATTLGSDVQEAQEFFDQGALESIDLDQEHNIYFTKPYTGALEAKLIAIGDYNVLKEALRGPIQLDEASRGQVLFLSKYLGNYDINKIEDHFLIRKNNRAVILQKSRW